MGWVIVTGASSGIGAATARQLAAQGKNLILLARREERLKALADELTVSFSVQIKYFAIDVRDSHSVESLFGTTLKPNQFKVDVLINNAGLAKGVDKLHEAKISDWDQMIDTNVKGLLYLTRAVLPSMIQNGSGHIVNIGSVAGRWVYPGGGVYCATKFAVRALSEGLRMDLLGTSIRVTNIEPGMAETEFSEVRLGDPHAAKAIYEGMTPLADEDVAETILWCLSRPPHVNVQELVLFPTAQAGVGMVSRSR